MADDDWNLYCLGPIACPECGAKCGLVDEDGLCVACGGGMFHDEDGNATANFSRLAAHELLVRAEKAEAERDEARANLAAASRVWDGPETSDFVEGTRKEAAHQVARWGTSHDAAKGAEDFFWLLGYLAGKALSAAKAGDSEKAKHHTISSAACLLNWHAHLTAGRGQFQPGSDKIHTLARGEGE